MKLGSPAAMSKEPGGPADAPVRDEDVSCECLECGRKNDALKAVLLFYRAGPWDDAVRSDWTYLTGKTEATTKALCDAVRAALAPFRPATIADCPLSPLQKMERKCRVCDEPFTPRHFHQENCARHSQ